MSFFTLADTTEFETVVIRVKNRDKMIAFYRDLIGFTLKGEENALAIMEIEEEKKERLWLEESPRADEHFGEIKKLYQYTLTLNSVAELSDLYARLEKNEYPIVHSEFEDEIRFVLLDPEENQLKIRVRNQEQIQDRTQLLALTKGKFAKLSKDSSIQTIHLNVTDQKKEANFLQNILGFQLDSDNPNHYYSENRDFGVTLHFSNSQAVKVDPTEILGLEILRFAVTKTGMEKLEQHLLNSKQDYYIDKKKTILTIYDPLGIEWWFVSKK